MGSVSGLSKIIIGRYSGNPCSSCVFCTTYSHYPSNPGTDILEMRHRHTKTFIVNTYDVPGVGRSSLSRMAIRSTWSPRDDP
jgi:hypothetical protein